MTPPPTKIHIGRLTRNVNRDHLQEIFSTFGKIKDIEFGSERMRPWLNKGFAYIEYDNSEDAKNALRHMDGGQIDGQEVTAAPVLVPRYQPRRRSPPRRRSRSPPRRRSRSPPRRSPPRRRFGGRSRSPPRRRSPSPRRRSRSRSGRRSRSPPARRGGRSPPRRRSRSPARRRRDSSSSSSDSSR